MHHTGLPRALRGSVVLRDLPPVTALWPFAPACSVMEHAGVGQETYFLEEKQPELPVSSP